MKNLFKTILISIFLLVNFSSTINSKPIPPGSGKGDVPANILILLDSSVSMRNPVEGGTGVRGVDWAVEDSDGNLIVSENNRGLFKYLVADEERDGEWNDGEGEFRGTQMCPDMITFGSNKSWAGDITANDEIWFTTYGDGGQIIRLNSDGVCTAVINRITDWSRIEEGGVITRPNGTGIAMAFFLEVREINGEEILFVGGRTFSGGRHRAKMYVRNLATGASRNCPVSGGTISSMFENFASSMTVSNDGGYIYFAKGTKLYAYPLTNNGSNLYCPSSTYQMELDPHNDRVRDSSGTVRSNISGVKKISGIEFSRNESNVIYLTSIWDHAVQRIQVDPSSFTVSIDATIGKYGTEKNTGDPGTRSSENVNLSHPGRSSSQGAISNNISISDNRDSILVGDRNFTVQRFTKTLFTTDDQDTSWHSAYFNRQVSKFEGAKDAIEAIVSDSSLNAGANFGFGHWNSGMYDLHNRRGNPNHSSYGGEVYCHRNGDCLYYNGWNGTPADGRSDPCLRDYCIMVGVSPSGSAKILEALDSFSMAWGTDGNSFSQMALDYFRDENVGMINEDLACQLNYVIVISDGHIRNASEAFTTLATLRENEKIGDTDDDVITLMVGYGGSYDNANAKVIFDRLARAGSCDEPGTYTTPSSNVTNCQNAIGANTPSDLKTEIGAKIRQIIADRLSFSAPSITATLQEGGAIYQAQFDYLQHSEWSGKLLRKTILPNGEIKHDPDYGENWEAGAVMKANGSDVRKIWTPLASGSGGTTNYVGYWNNWNEDNYVQINDLFEMTGNIVRDFHNSNTTCAGTGDVADGNVDDIKGLINFIRGEDYFDYKGGCDIYDDRNWSDEPEASMLGDIYHSQLVEVGEPNANTTFTANNQEAYWRSINNYAAFKKTQLGRSKIIYAGSNAGMLHAFRAEGPEGVRGKEEWAFVPPFIAAQMPQMLNTNLEGAFERDGVTYSGSNAIFGVDGSPIIHDVFIQGLNEDGTEYEDAKSWRTLLMVPFGRGGPGFSVLDVTNPVILEGAVGADGVTRAAGSGPLHMFSIFNDSYTNEVVRVDHNGSITRIPYTRFSLTIDDTEEAKKALEVYEAAKAKDIENDALGFDVTERNKVADCIGNEDTDDGDFRDKGTNSCYTDKVFVFDTIIGSQHLNSDKTVKVGYLKIKEKIDGEWKDPVGGVEAKMVSNRLHITFSGEPRTINAGLTDTATTIFKIETDCSGSGTSDVKFDYSALGETWSTPRIFRIPTASAIDITDDRYVAVMGGGMGASNMCAGSGLYVVDLEGGPDENDDSTIDHNAGSLFTDGPIPILDSNKDRAKMGSAVAGTFDKGSPITNSVPATPVVITADKTDANWRGAMVYVNDLEGKILKFNFTSEGTLFDQKILMNLNADFDNARHSFFEMDAAIGETTRNLWLFGGTGNFNRIADTVNAAGLSTMDNIVYGLKDPDFPDFGPSSGLLYDSDDYIDNAIDALSLAVDVDESALCKRTNESPGAPVCEVSLTDLAWRYHLGAPDDQPLDLTANNFRKTSAAPTVYRGRVYFPVYEPNKDFGCQLGTAYVCSYNDECGYLDTEGIDPEGEVPEGNCFEVGSGILSKLVVFGDSMFANLAGPSATEDTLVKILASDQQFRSFKRSWRENF